MNKTELIAEIAERAEISKKDAEKALKAFTREGRNPKSGEPMRIEASKSPKFKAGKALKDMVNA